ncbi:glycoside hydrolase family 16 protein [Suillus variegatus]|nr:glycoside hydrolase family 16 protein [Suillus variegatus]
MLKFHYCKEPDDDLHNPNVRDHNTWGPDHGLANIGCLLVLGNHAFVSVLACPSVLHSTEPGYLQRWISNDNLFTGTTLSNQGGFNLGGINASKQPSWNGGPDLQLVFSYEFNTPGRTFWPGDDPYWEAVNGLEWYGPEAITTQDGYLVIALSQKQTHNLNYQGGENKFCFSGGYIEASVSLPGVNDVVGLWPAIWTLGNLGRAGHGASLEGMWPYTYDACDVGTAPNQTFNGLPLRLSRCTCKGESHPGPVHSDGTFVGRAAPEVDMFEARVWFATGDPLTGQVSQSAQWAPFNAGYIWLNTSSNEIIPNPSATEQQAASGVTTTNQDCYEGETGCFSVYDFEYITWIANDEVAWTLKVAGSGMGPDPPVDISARPIPTSSWICVDLTSLPFPVHMRVDYMRVYQPSNARNIGCDPKDFPTADYINTYTEAYTNPNLITWKNDCNRPFSKNSFLDQC